MRVHGAGNYRPYVPRVEVNITTNVRSNDPFNDNEVEGSPRRLESGGRRRQATPRWARISTGRKIGYTLMASVCTIAVALVVILGTYRSMTGVWVHKA